MKLLLLSILLCWCGDFFAQSVQDDTLFFDENWLPTPDRTKATYYREITPETNDSSILVEDYYLESGNLQMIGYYKNEVKPGNQNGLFTFFYKNGMVKATYEYTNGLFDGKAKRFYENGKISAIETFKNGLETDTLITFHENGRTREIKVINPDYSADNPADYFKRYRLLDYLDENGKQYVTNGDGTYIEFQENGLKLLEITYVNGFPNGEWIRYRIGQKKAASRMCFKDGTFIKGVIYDHGKKDIFSSVFREPRYPGGREALNESIAKNTGFCEDNTAGEILVAINVYEDGTAEFEQVISGNPTSCQVREIKKFVRLMPHWSTAVEKGRYTDSSCIIRFTY